MILSDEVELRVCKKCDAPLPYKPISLSYFNKVKLNVDINE